MSHLSHLSSSLLPPSPALSRSASRSVTVQERVLWTFLVALLLLSPIFWLIHIGSAFITPLVYATPTYSATMLDTNSSAYHLLDRRASWSMWGYKESNEYSNVTGPAALVVSSYEYDGDMSGCSVSVYTEVTGVVEGSRSDGNRPTGTRDDVDVPGCAALTLVRISAVPPGAPAGRAARQEEVVGVRLRRGAGLESLGAALRA